MYTYNTLESFVVAINLAFCVSMLFHGYAIFFVPYLSCFLAVLLYHVYINDWLLTKIEVIEFFPNDTINFAKVLVLIYTLQHFYLIIDSHRKNNRPFLIKDYFYYFFVFIFCINNFFIYKKPYLLFYGYCRPELDVVSFFVVVYLLAILHLVFFTITLDIFKHREDCDMYKASPFHSYFGNLFILFFNTYLIC